VIPLRLFWLDLPHIQEDDVAPKLLYENSFFFKKNLDF